MSRPDVVIYSPDQQVQLVVEVKGKAKSASNDWAARMRHNLLAHSMVPKSPYFMLVLPDHIFMWSDGDDDASPPEETASTHKVLGSYLPPAFRSESAAPVSEQGLELAVFAWLSDLVDGSSTDKDAEPEWLQQSGLLNSIRSGSVVSAPAL